MKLIATTIAVIGLAAMPVNAQENIIPNASFTQFAKNGMPSQWSGQLWKNAQGKFSFDKEENAIRMVKSNDEGLSLISVDFLVPGQAPCEITISFELMVPETTLGSVVFKRDGADGKNIFYQEVLKINDMTEWKKIEKTVKCPSTGKVNLSFRLQKPGEILIRNVSAVIGQTTEAK